MVQAAVKKSVDALITRDAGLAQSVLAGDAAIDEEEVEIERQAINLLALHQPAAGDLRTVFAVVKINGDLERIADCAVNVAQQVGPFVKSAGELPRDMRIMGEAVLKQVEDTLRCLGNKDPDMAEIVTRGDDAVDALYHQVVQELQAGMVARSTEVAGNLALIMAAKNFERIGDHCTNIAEDVVYRMRGRIVRHTH